MRFTIIYFILLVSLIVNSRGQAVPVPSILPEEAHHIGEVEVVFNSSSTQVELTQYCYTTDGQTPIAPTASSQGSSTTCLSYDEPLYLYASPSQNHGYVTVKVITVVNGESSDVVEKSYRILKICAKPVLSPSNGTFVGSVSISIKSPEKQCQLFYTTDKSTPQNSARGSTHQVDENNLVTLDQFGNMVLKVISSSGLLDSAYAPSDIVIGFYDILPKVREVIILPSRDVFALSATLSMSCDTPDATIYYTTNGRTPSKESMQYYASSPVRLKQLGSHTVKAIAMKDNMISSDVVVKNLKILDELLPPALNPVSGEYVDDISVTITCATEDENDNLNEDNRGKIYYTIHAHETPNPNNGKTPYLHCGEAVLLKAPGSYVLRSIVTAPSMVNSPLDESFYTLTRPRFEETALDLELNAFQVQPKVQVIPLVLPSSLPLDSAFTKFAPVSGHLVILENVLGHFDVLPPGNWADVAATGPEPDFEGLCEGLNAVESTSRSFLDVSDIDITYDDQIRDDMSDNYPPFNKNKTPKEEDIIEEMDIPIDLENDRLSRYAYLVPKDTSSEEWSQWMKQYTTVRDSNLGCEVSAPAGYFNLSDYLCHGHVVSQGQLIHQAAAYEYIEHNEKGGVVKRTKNVHFGIRNASYFVGYVDTEELHSEENPFDVLLGGSGWLVRNQHSYIAENVETDSEDLFFEKASAASSHSAIPKHLARTVIGYDIDGRLMLLQVSGQGEGMVSMSGDGPGGKEDAPEEASFADISAVQSVTGGLSLEDLAEWCVRLGFVNAINLVGGDVSDLLVNATSVSTPSASCSPEYTYGKGGYDRESILDDPTLSVEIDGRIVDFSRCPTMASTVVCFHSMIPPISVELAESLFPPMEPGPIIVPPSHTPEHDQSKPSNPASSPTPWPTFNWRSGDDDTRHMPSSGSEGEYPRMNVSLSIVQLNELTSDLHFYKDTTVLLSAICVFLFCMLMYICRNKRGGREIQYMDNLDNTQSSIADMGMGGHYPMDNGGIQLSEPRRSPSSVNTSQVSNASNSNDDIYRLPSRGPEVGRVSALRWQDKIGQLNMDSSDSDGGMDTSTRSTTPMVQRSSGKKKKSKSRNNSRSSNPMHQNRNSEYHDV